VLLQGSPLEVAATSVAVMIGITALSAGIAGWLRRRASGVERLLLVTAATLLFLPQPAAALSGAAIAAATVGSHWRRR
jgi:TRAP-type uncharacterized transport system fused permease subunit